MCIVELRLGVDVTELNQDLPQVVKTSEMSVDSVCDHGLLLLQLGRNHCTSSGSVALGKGSLLWHCLG